MGKGHCRNLLRGDLSLRQKIIQPGCQGSGLSRTRPGNHRHTASRLFHGLPLAFIEKRLCALILPSLLRLFCHFRSHGFFRHRSIALRFYPHFPAPGCLAISFRAFVFFRLLCRKEAHLSLQAVSFLLGQQPDLPILPVKTGFPLHLAHAQTPDALCHQGTCGFPDILNRNFPQNDKFRSQRPCHLFIFFRRLLPRRRNSHGSADYLHKRHQTLEGPPFWQDKSLLPVRKLLHPVHHPDGYFLSAHRASVSIPGSLPGTDAQAAFPVPVKMIFPLLRKKLNGTCQSLSQLYGICQSPIGQFHIQQTGFPSQFCRGMGIGIGYQAETVQRPHAPVHGRIGRKPCLQGMNMGCQIFKALFHGIKSRKSAKHGKMGRPDMGRHINSIRAGLQHDFQQIPAGNPQNGPPIGMNVPYQLQPPCHCPGRLQPRQNQQAVHLSHPVSLFVDGTDLPRDHKPGIRGRRCSLQPVFLFQYIQSILCRFQLFRQFIPPGRMGKIPGSHNVDSFFSGPQIQVFRRAVPAGGPGIPGMNMQISYVHLSSHSAAPGRLSPDSPSNRLSWVLFNDFTFLSVTLSSGPTWPHNKGDNLSYSSRFFFTLWSLRFA